LLFPPYSAVIASAAKQSRAAERKGWIASTGL
jgi:hypothetical protein